jgi:hypothetical protein
MIHRISSNHPSFANYNAERQIQEKLHQNIPTFSPRHHSINCMNHNFFSMVASRRADQMKADMTFVGGKPIIDFAINSI